MIAQIILIQTLILNPLFSVQMSYASGRHGQPVSSVTLNEKVGQAFQKIKNWEDVPAAMAFSDSDTAFYLKQLQKNGLAGALPKIKVSPFEIEIQGSKFSILGAPYGIQLTSNNRNYFLLNKNGFRGIFEKLSKDTQSSAASKNKYQFLLEDSAQAALPAVILTLAGALCLYEGLNYVKNKVADYFLPSDFLKESLFNIECSKTGEVHKARTGWPVQDRAALVADGLSCEKKSSSESQYRACIDTINENMEKYVTYRVILWNVAKDSALITPLNDSSTLDVLDKDHVDWELFKKQIDDINDYCAGDRLRKSQLSEIMESNRAKYIKALYHEQERKTGEKIQSRDT